VFLLVVASIMRKRVPGLAWVTGWAWEMVQTWVYALTA